MELALIVAIIASALSPVLCAYATSRLTVRVIHAYAQQFSEHLQAVLEHAEKVRVTGGQPVSILEDKEKSHLELEQQGRAIKVELEKERAGIERAKIEAHRDVLIAQQHATVPPDEEDDAAEA